MKKTIQQWEETQAAPDSAQSIGDVLTQLMLDSMRAPHLLDVLIGVATSGLEMHQVPDDQQLALMLRASQRAYVEMEAAHQRTVDQWEKIVVGGRTIADRLDYVVSHPNLHSLPSYSRDTIMRAVDFTLAQSGVLEHDKREILIARAVRRIAVSRGLVPPAN